MIILYFGFWPQEVKNKLPKRASRGSYKGNRFCILDGTKYDLEIFDILYSTILK